MDPLFEELLRRNDISPEAVIDANITRQPSYMWRTKADWPAGGTYEAPFPRNGDDEPVAQKVDTVAVVEIVGRHPRGVLLPVSDDFERSRVEISEHGNWVFND